MALADDFKARFPEFEATVVTTYIPILEPVYPAYYALEYVAATKEIILNLLAHLITMEISAGPDALKNIESKSVGSVSVSYSAATYQGGELFDFMRGSKYGQRFLVLTASRYGGKAV